MAGDFEPKPGDPADREAPVNHRAGYGENKLQRIERWARQGNTLAAGEGAALVEELDRLRATPEEREALARVWNIAWEAVASGADSTPFERARSFIERHGGVV